MKPTIKTIAYNLFCISMSVALVIYGILPILGPPKLKVHAQGTATPYDCTFVYNFTTTGAQTGQANSNSSRPCVAWRVTFTTTGFTNATIQFETSPDNSSWTAVPNTVCSASVQPPCVLDGANPMTAAAQGTVGLKAYGKYVRVNVTGVSGSGTGAVVVYGNKGANTASSIGGGGSGGGGVSYCPATSSGGSGVTWTCTAVPAVSSLGTAGPTLDFVPDVTTGATPTINANGLGAVAIKMANGSTPIAGAFLATQHYLMVYNGTNFVVQTFTQANGNNSSSPATTAFVNNQLCSIAEFNPAADGSTNDAAVFTTAAATCTTITLTPGKQYFIGTNLTLTSGITAISPPSGGPFVIGTGITLTLNGSIDSPLKQLFTLQGTGAVVIGPNNIVYPEWWGALGDNSNDDTTAINKALLSVTLGGVVQLQAKTYKTTAALSITNNGTVLRGLTTFAVGTTGTLISNTATTGDVIAIIGTVTTCLAGSVNNVTVRDLAIKRVTPATAGTGINLTNTCWPWIENVVSTDSFNQFKLVSARSGTWVNITALYTSSSASVRSGIDVDSTAGNGSFTSYFLKAQVVGTGSNIKGFYLHGTKIQDITVDHLETALVDYGVDIITDTGTLANDVHFTNSILDNCNVECIRVTTVNNVSNSVEITGGQLYAPNGIGVHLINSRGVIISGMFTYLGNSVLLDTSSAYNTITGNVFNVATGKYGVKLDGSVAGNVISNNVFNGSATATVLLSLVNTSVLNIITGNVFGGTATTGVNFDATSGPNVVYPNQYLSSALGTKIANAGAGNDFGPPAGTPAASTCGTIGTGSTNPAGFITSATTGSCVSVLTFAKTIATTGWSCGINNSTTPANPIVQTGSSTTTATFTGTTVSGDVLRYMCTPY